MIRNHWSRRMTDYAATQKTAKLTSFCKRDSIILFPVNGSPHVVKRSSNKPFYACQGSISNDFPWVSGFCSSKAKKYCEEEKDPQFWCSKINADVVNYKQLLRWYVLSRQTNKTRGNARSPNHKCRGSRTRTVPTGIQVPLSLHSSDTKCTLCAAWQQSPLIYRVAICSNEDLHHSKPAIQTQLPYRVTSKEIVCWGVQVSLTQGELSADLIAMASHTLLHMTSQT